LDKESDLEALRTALQEYQELQSSLGWRRYSGDLAAQVRGRKLAAFRPFSSLDDAIRASSEMGEVAGLELARNMLEFLIHDTRAGIDALLEEERGDEDGGRESSSDVGSGRWR